MYNPRCSQRFLRIALLWSLSAVAGLGCKAKAPAAQLGAALQAPATAAAGETALAEAPSPAGQDPAVQESAAPKRVKAGKTEGFVVVPAGRFDMGQSDEDNGPGYNDAPKHPVTLSRPFEMMSAEVTAQYYASVMATSADQLSGCANCPATMVSWYQAATFCNELSKKQALAPCYRIDGFAVHWPEGVACSGYRLPTEAEWEHAARAGETASAPANIMDSAWFDENSNLKLQAIKGKRANAFGLYDMLGNAGEWVWDWQGEYPRSAVSDPLGPKTGDNRVFRGGNYRYGKGEASFAFRSAYGPPVRVEYLGFRCVRTLPL